MVLSDSKDLLEQINDLRDYDNKTPKDVHYNYKMTDIQAAMGLVQLDRLTSFINRRKFIAQRYNEAFKTLEIQLPPRDEGHIYYRYVAGLKNDAGPAIQALATKGIQCARPVYMPLHRFLKVEGYIRTEEAWSRSLSIPIYPTLTEENIKQISESVAGVIKEASP
jgi:perosamine synthetase